MWGNSSIEGMSLHGPGSEPLAGVVVRARIIPTDGSPNIKLGWPALAQINVVEAHIKSVLGLEQRDRLVLFTGDPRDPSNFTKCAISGILRAAASVSVGAEKDGAVATFYFDGAESTPHSRFRRASVAGRTEELAITLAAIEDLSALETTTTWLAAERVILATTRFLCVTLKVVLESLTFIVHGVDDLTDDLAGRARWSSPPYFATVLLCFGLAVAVFINYRRILLLPRDDLVQWLFSGGGRLDRESWVLCSALVVLSGLAYITCVFIQNISQLAG